MEMPQPRERYNFGEMAKDEVKNIHIPDDKPDTGKKALCAAYAYARRNGRKFCGATETIRGKKYMLIRRIK